MLSHKEEHAKLAIEDLKNYGDPSCVEWIKCDLEDLSEVDRTVRDLREKVKERLDVPVCNAGLGVGVYNESKNGLSLFLSNFDILEFACAEFVLIM